MFLSRNIGVEVKKNILKASVLNIGKTEEKRLLTFKTRYNGWTHEIS